MKFDRCWWAWIWAVFVLAGLTNGTVPGAINYQGRISVDGIPFSGEGLFRFAIVDSGTEPWSHLYWSSDGNNPPEDAIWVEVTDGLYSVTLGEAPQISIPKSVFGHDEVYLAVWFNDGITGFQHLEPNQRLWAVGYALHSVDAENAVMCGGVSSTQLLRNDQDGLLTGSLDVQGLLSAEAMVASVIKASSDNSVATVDFETLPNNAQNSGITIGKLRAMAGQNNGQPYVWIRGNGAHSWILDYTPEGTLWAQSIGAYYNNVKQGNIGFLGTGPTVDYLSIGYGGYAWWNSQSKFILWKSGRAQFMPPQAANGSGSLVEPPAWLVLAPGGSDPMSAPLKFRSGSLLSNPEAGAVEWDGDRLYITDSAETRRAFAFSGGGFSAGSVPFVDVDGELTSDGSLIWDHNQKRLGVGILPAATFHISGPDLNFVDRYTSVTGYGAGLALRRARGSAEAPEAVQTDDLLGSINYRGYNGTEFSATSAAVFGFAAENWNTFQQGSYISFYTTDAGGKSLSEKMRLTDSGKVGVGLTNPTAHLHVKGRTNQVQTQVQGHTAQTEDLSQWLNATGTILAHIDSAGKIRATDYESADGSPGATGTHVIVTGITQDPTTKDITVTTKTITYKNGLITNVE